MITRQLYNSNWSYLLKRRFDANLADNDRDNSKRLEHFYNTGDHVMLRVPKKFRSKLHAVATGPFVIRQVHTNDTVTIDKGKTAELVCIRRVFPCQLSQIMRGVRHGWSIYMTCETILGLRQTKDNCARRKKIAPDFLYDYTRLAYQV